MSWGVHHSISVPLDLGLGPTVCARLLIQYGRKCTTSEVEIDRRGKQTQKADSGLS